MIRSRPLPQPRTHKTKIVCTLGPASSSYSMIRKLAEAGMDVVRLNFSYGAYAQFERVIYDIRRVERILKKPIGILQDLQGPRIRLGELPSPLQVKEGDSILFSSRSSSSDTVPLIYAHLTQNLEKGNRILIGDGALTFKVEKIHSKGVSTVSLSKGILKSHQGVHFPDSEVHIPCPTEKDYKDFEFGLRQGVDFVALSFVKSRNDLERLRQRMKQSGHQPHLISKIERPQAIENLDEILGASDGTLVARGDLGLEMGLEEIPILQKKIIGRAAYFGKYVMTATQMLESMIEKENPTRAEVSDVANAVLDGTDAVMLSGETAAGQFPVESVQMMAKILERVEREIPLIKLKVGEGNPALSAFGFAQAASEIAEKMKIDRIVPFTFSGSTALRVSKFRPQALVIAMTPQESTWRKMTLFWGVIPLLTPMVKNTDQMFSLARRELKKRKLVGNSKSIVLITGIPIQKPGITNLLRVDEV
ncbi:MAG: pyruvate kinase [Chlamydiae bacterium]|nr:pyruvate kinase [Chlamydiota bacterium]MBI3278055.1 pyruvate kinase [Chlamydiota bacterium]